MIFRRLFQRLSGGAPAPAAPVSPLAPESPFVAVGDVHGRADLLERLLARLEQDAPGLPVVFVGDYIDRGEDSARVLADLHALERTEPRVTCLFGNHEEMCLRFLEAPEAQGERWLRYGGLQTLASYGVADVTRRVRAGELVAIRDELAGKMGHDLVGWLRTRPVLWQNGNVAVVHAGADPARPLDTQRGSLVWGHPEFESVPRQDGLWIVHGHTIVDAPLAEAGRIAIDTGAYATGRLTAAVVAPGAPPRFVTA